MKHAQIAIINPAVSPVIHGMLLIKPARNNAVVPISILVQEATKPVEAVRLVVENIRLVNVQVGIVGMGLVVRKQVIMKMRKFIALKEL